MRIINNVEARKLGGLNSERFQEFVRKCGELVFIRPPYIVEGTEGDKIFTRLCAVKEKSFYELLEFGLDLNEASVALISVGFYESRSDEDE